MNNNFSNQIVLAKQRIEKVMRPLKGNVTVRVGNNQHGIYETKIQIKGIKNILFSKKKSKSLIGALIDAEDAIKKQILKNRRKIIN